MAAGESRRWGLDNKLLAAIGGVPMIRLSAAAILASHVRPVIVVTGHEADAVRRALAGMAVSWVHAPDFADGMSASLKAGVAAVPPDCGAALICLGDMPFVMPATLDALGDRWTGRSGGSAPAGRLATSDRAALVPTIGGVRGNPVLLGRSLFGQIAGLSGDRGARTLLAAMPDRVGEVAVDDPGILRDIDRPEALRDTLA